MLVHHMWCVLEWIHVRLPKMILVDVSHLSGLLGAVALDADNHLFDFAYAIVSGENKEDWY